MATFIKATSSEGSGTLYINLDTVAWMVSQGGGTRIVFTAVALDSDDTRQFLAVSVNESGDELLKAPRL